MSKCLALLEYILHLFNYIIFIFALLTLLLFQTIITTIIEYILQITPVYFWGTASFNGENNVLLNFKGLINNIILYTHVMSKFTA